MSLVCGVTENVYLGNDVPGLFQILIAPLSPAKLMNPFILWDWFVNLWDMLWFNYSFFHGSWKIVQYIFQCISLGLVVSFGALIIPSLLTAGRSLIGHIAGALTGRV